METIFRVTGYFFGEFTDQRCIPLKKASDAEFDVFVDLRLNKRLSKQSRRCCSFRCTIALVLTWLNLRLLVQQNPMHYIDVIMTTMASQITSFTVVYSTVYSDADQRKHQSYASLAFVWGIHRTGEFPAQKASYAENVSIWWRHHGFCLCHYIIFIGNLQGYGYNLISIGQTKHFGSTNFAGYCICLYAIFCVIVQIDRMLLHKIQFGGKRMGKHDVLG